MNYHDVKFESILELAVVKVRFYERNNKYYLLSNTFGDVLNKFNIDLDHVLFKGTTLSGLYYCTSSEESNHPHYIESMSRLVKNLSIILYNARSVKLDATESEFIAFCKDYLQLIKIGYFLNFLLLDNLKRSEDDMELLFSIKELIVRLNKDKSVRYVYTDSERFEIMNFLLTHKLKKLTSPVVPLVTLATEFDAIIDEWDDLV